MTSFSQKVKKEILKAKRDSDALFCMLCGEILSAGSLLINNHEITFVLSSESKEFLTAVEGQLFECFEVEKSSIKISKEQGSIKEKFELSISPFFGRRVLEGLKILSRDENGNTAISRSPEQHFLQDKGAKIAYLAGAFCGAGSISVPETGGKSTGGYHMEWVCQTPERAQVVCEILAEFDIISKKIERNGSSVAYIKESDAICQILALMGAVASMLELENSKVEREVRNNINRQSNCMSANLDKVMNASVKQMQAIDEISRTVGIESLPEDLLEVALARVTNPEASLSELVKILGNKISRVAVSQRLAKIIKLAQELGGENG